MNCQMIRYAGRGEGIGRRVWEIIILLIEDDPEDGYVVRAMGESFLRRLTAVQSYENKYAMLFIVIIPTHKTALS
jgi:hypothetical protein